MTKARFVWDCYREAWPIAFGKKPGLSVRDVQNSRLIVFCSLGIAWCLMFITLLTIFTLT